MKPAPLARGTPCSTVAWSRETRRTGEAEGAVRGETQTRRDGRLGKSDHELGAFEDSFLGTRRSVRSHLFRHVPTGGQSWSLKRGKRARFRRCSPEWTPRDPLSAETMPIHFFRGRTSSPPPGRLPPFVDRTAFSRRRSVRWAYRDRPRITNPRGTMHSGDGCSSGTALGDESANVEGKRR